MKNEIRNLQEPFEDNDSLLKKIFSYGSIKNIIKSKDILMNILTYDGDRHLLLVFVEQLNNAIYSGKINYKDLKILKSNWLIQQILNLEYLVKSNGRNLYEKEVEDKINYLTLIKNNDVLESIFTNSALINQIIKNPQNYKYNYWIMSGSIYINIPYNIQKKIAYEFMIKGNYTLGTYILNTANEYNKRMLTFENIENEHYSVLVKKNI